MDAGIGEFLETSYEHRKSVASKYYSTRRKSGIVNAIRRDWFKLLSIFFRLQRYIYNQQQHGTTDIRNLAIVPQIPF